MKTKTDEAYRDLKNRLLYQKLFFTENVAENFKILDNELNTVNIMKCGLMDLEMESPGSSNYLAYLLQSNNKADFGLCEKVKIWRNQSGFQSRCQHDGKLMLCRCFGNLNNCSILDNKPKKT